MFKKNNSKLKGLGLLISKGSSFMKLSSIVIMLMLSAGAHAQSQAACSIASSPMSFGVYSPFATTDVLSSTNIDVTCLGLKTAANLQIRLGSSNSLTLRQMRNTSNVTGTTAQNTLNYRMYTDSSRTLLWGDGTGSTYSINIPFSLILNFKSVTVYGRVAMGQNVYPGYYTESTTVDIIY